MDAVVDDMGPSAVLLLPRPFAKASGRLVLLPLLPHKCPAKPLPSEIWARIFGHLFNEYTVQHQNDVTVSAQRRGLLLVCKTLTAVALPLFYERVSLRTIVTLEQFTNRLYISDKQWDSIRRIPYSTPGRWVQTLDLSELQCLKFVWTEMYHIDTLLTRLLPLVPFLAHLVLNPSVALSRRMMTSLYSRDGNQNISSLRGIRLNSPITSLDESLVQVLRFCPNLVELECLGPGYESSALDIGNDTEPQGPQGRDAPEPLSLPLLQKVALISMHTSPVMRALLYTPLPSLTHLTVTPYDDASVPTSLVPQLIERHGPSLLSLHLFAPKTWPTMLFPSPTTLLYTCPKLRRLSLENPLPTLTICSIYPKHPLQILSIPRPDANFLTVLESLLPKLPSLRAVRARDVRWLRPGMGARAQEAGVQGQMRGWQRRLGRRGVRVLDSEWQLGMD